MRKLFLSVLCLSFSIVSLAQKKEWSLEQCITHALENNISVKQSELDLELSELDRKDAFGAFIPSINGSASTNWNTGLTTDVTTGILQTQTTRNFSAGVTASLTLFDGLRNFKTVQRAKMAQLASRYSLELMKDDIALMVANSYLQVLFNKENLKVIQAQHQITQQQLERTEELVEAGSLPGGDLLEIRANHASENQRIIVAENEVRVALIGLAQLLLIKDYENFDIQNEGYEVFQSEVLHASVSEVVDRATDERYEIKVAEENQRIAEKDIELAKGAYYPTLGAFFNYNTRESGMGRMLSGGIDPDNPTRQIGIVESTGESVVAPNTVTEIGSPLPFFEQLYLNDGISFGAQLSIPFLNGFSTRNNVRRSEINARRAGYQLEQAKMDLESNVYQAYVDTQGALKAYEAAQAAEVAQELAFEYATERFDVGMTTAFEYSQVQFEYESAQTEALRAKFDYIFKLKVLELYFGIPITDLNF